MMIEPPHYQTGIALARNHATRRLVNELAQRLPADKGDQLIAGYYAELRRIAAAPKGWAYVD